MKKALLSMILLAGTALAGPRFSVGIGFGAPAPVAAVRPLCPGPGYVWVEGYYGPSGYWVPGFWRAPAYGFAVAPRFVEPRNFAYGHDRRGYDRGYDRHEGDRGYDRHEADRGYRHDFRR